MGSYVVLLRANRDFRNLWLATVISFAGDWFNFLASAALIGTLTQSGLAVSLLFLCRYLPLFFLAPWAGVLADRFDRKQILIFADLARAVVVGCLVLVQWTGLIWLLYGLTVLQFALSSLFQPAHAAAIPNLVAEKDLVAANAIDGFTWSVMLAVGALLGGIVTTLVGITACFLLDALTFVVSAWFISRISGPTRRAAPVANQREGVLAFVDGLRYLRQRPFLLGIALVKTGAALLWGVLNVVELPLARDYFPLGRDGSLSLAIFYAMTGIGSGIGPLVVRRWLGDGQRASLWAILLGYALSTVGVFWLSMAHNLPEAALAGLVRTLGGGALWVFSAALLQMLADDAFRGRVAAFEFAAFTLTQSLATLWAGYAQDAWHLNIPQILQIATLVSLGMTGVWLFFQRWAVRLLTKAESGGQGRKL